jgi:Ca2+-binding RTX toxin-like protein
VRTLATRILVLGAVIAAALPGAALAATVEVRDEGLFDHVLIYRAERGEANDLEISLSAGTVTLTDQGAVISALDGSCTEVSEHQVQCWAADEQRILLGDLDDSAQLIQGVREFVISGGRGADELLVCASCAAELKGRTGNDILAGGDIARMMFGGSGNDAITGGTSTDLIFGGEHSDTIHGRGREDAIVGGPGPDRLIGGRGSDRLAGEEGSDRMLGRAGDDRLIARDGGTDFVSGGEGSDRARVDAALDVVRSIEVLF